MGFQKNEISFTEKIHFDNKGTPNGPKEGKESVQRNIVQCFAQHKQTKKYLLLKRKQLGLISPVGGGIEEGQSIEDAIKTELLEEAGYREVDNISLISSNVSFESYIEHKDRNVYGHTTIVYCEIDGEPEPISEHERKVHEPFFADESEVEGLFNIENIKYLWQQYLMWKASAGKLSYTGELKSTRKEKLKEYKHIEDGYIYSARAIIKNEKGEILLMFDKRFDAYTVPGGKRDSGDESLEHALAREVKEEIGLNVISSQELGRIKAIWSGGAICHIYFEVEVSGDIKLSESHMSSVHRGSYTETKSSLGFDICIDGKAIDYEHNLNLSRSRYDMLEYYYLKQNPYANHIESVLLPTFLDLSKEYVSCIKNGTLSFIELEKRTISKGFPCLQQPAKELLIGLERVFNIK